MLNQELRSASQIVALVGLVFSVLMLIPWLASVFTGWAGGEPFLWSGLTTGLVCALVMLAGWGDAPRVSTRFGVIVVNMLWWVLPLICAIPLMNSTGNFSFTDSLFEATSGLTTTGSTIVTDIVHQSRPVLLWRAIMQWIGGLGILSLGLILLPFLRVGGMQLFRMESSDRSEKPLPRLIEIAKSIIIIYLVLSILCVIGYLSVGMAPFDALTHAMTTVATGGFSTHDESLGYYGGWKVLWVAIIFMIAGALPFSFFIAVFFARNMPRYDTQIVVFLLIAISACGILLVADGFQRANTFTEFSQYIFNVVSILTTTGYASGNFMDYGGIGATLFFFLIFIGGCAGSTSGGIKIYRLIVLGQLIRTSLQELLYKRGVFLMRYGKQIVDKDVFRSSMVMLCCFFVFLAIFTVILGALGADFITALSGAATALANVGPGIGDVIGPAGSFSSLSDAEKYVLVFAMIIGRLELLVALALFVPILWRD
ncbi:MAG: TrkH family potassium uptake protein [Pseudomonadota bacterium]|nr:TrkH family potassium uptake protein [Pseudomonadota bacterium]